MERNVRQHNTRVMQPRNLIHVPCNITRHLPSTTDKDRHGELSEIILNKYFEFVPNIWLQLLARHMQNYEVQHKINNIAREKLFQKLCY